MFFSFFKLEGALRTSPFWELEVEPRILMTLAWVEKVVFPMVTIYNTSRGSEIKMKRRINSGRIVVTAVLVGFLMIGVKVNAQRPFPSSPPQFFPPTPSSPGAQPYKPIPPASPPQVAPSVPQGPSTMIKEKGVINPRTGEFYQGAFGGAIDPKTGVFLPKVGGGYQNPETGEVVPKQE